MHNLSNIMLSGKSTHGSWEMELSIEVQDKINVSRVEDVLTNYSLCDERRNHGHDSSCNGNLSIQVVTVFALEPQLR